MWIFTIVAATAVVGTVIWLDWPRWKAWATDTTPPRHRATADDIEHHANVLIARLEDELLEEARTEMERIADWVNSQPDFDTVDHTDWPVMIGAPAESIDDIESVHGTGDGNWYSIRTGELVVAAPAGFSERGE